MAVYKAIVLKAGYTNGVDESRLHADGTITLIKGPNNIIVDTGGPWDKSDIVDALRMESLTPDDISYVICTHGHSDHIGNINLFPNATVICSYDISKGDLYTIHDFASGKPYRIDEQIDVIATPGHTRADISVILRRETDTIAIVGDLFEHENDEGRWQELSENAEIQSKSREKIRQLADFIIPGHGGLFKVEK